MEIRCRQCQLKRQREGRTLLTRSKLGKVATQLAPQFRMAALSDLLKARKLEAELESSW